MQERPCFVCLEDATPADACTHCKRQYVCAACRVRHTSLGTYALACPCGERLAPGNTRIDSWDLLSRIEMFCICLLVVVLSKYAVNVAPPMPRCQHELWWCSPNGCHHSSRLCVHPDESATLCDCHRSLSKPWASVDYCEWWEERVHRYCYNDTTVADPYVKCWLVY